MSKYLLHKNAKLYLQHNFLINQNVDQLINVFFFFLYSVVNKPNKNVRIQLQNELTDDNDDDDTEAETEHTDEDRCLTPSNTYLEISFENQNQAQPKKQQQSPQKILPSQVYNSTPNGKVRTITQV